MWHGFGFLMDPKKQPVPFPTDLREEIAEKCRSADKSRELDGIEVLDLLVGCYGADTSGIPFSLLFGFFMSSPHLFRAYAGSSFDRRNLPESYQR